MLNLLPTMDTITVFFVVSNLKSLNNLDTIFRSSSVTMRLGTTSVFVSRFSGDNSESLRSITRPIFDLGSSHNGTLCVYKNVLPNFLYEILVVALEKSTVNQLSNFE